MALAARRPERDTARAMSEENLELAQQGLDAFNRRDIDAFLALCDPDVELTSRLLEVDGGIPYRGHDGVRTWWENLLGMAPDFSGEIDELRDHGDVTITRLRVLGHGIGSDAPMEQEQWHVNEWRKGRLVRFRAFRNEAEALEAAGLRE
jgi:ketosteroid isomerase-like protein